MTLRSAREETLQLLRERGVEYVFGNPGTTELGLISGLAPTVSYVLCLQESIAVGAATGYALFSGRAAVANLHALPGLGHAMGALHNARLMHAPVVAIVGQQHSRHLHREPLLSGDLVATARPAVKWAHQPARPDDVPSAVERAFRISEAPPRGPAMVAVPMDFWELDASPAAIAGSSRPPVVAGGPVEALLGQLREAQSAALVVGDQVNSSSSWEAATAVAEHFSMTVFSAPIGFQPGFPTGHARYAGVLPLSAPQVRDRLAPFDLVLVVGAPVFTLYLHEESPLIPQGSEIVLVTDDPDEAARAPSASFLLGDPASFLLSLAALESIEATPTTPGRPPVIEPLSSLDVRSAMAIVASLVPADAVFVDESMTAGDVVRQQLTISAPRSYLRTSTGVLGTGLPGSIGAALADPGRPVVVIIGDGSALFAPQALWTIAQWGLAVTVIVLNNTGYESLRGYERRHLQPAAGHSTSYDIRGVDIPSLAEALGVPGIAVDTPVGLASSLEDALISQGPAVIDVRLP